MLVAVSPAWAPRQRMKSSCSKNNRPRQNQRGLLRAVVWPHALNPGGLAGPDTGRGSPTSSAPKKDEGPSERWDNHSTFSTKLPPAPPIPAHQWAMEHVLPLRRRIVHTSRACNEDLTAACSRSVLPLASTSLRTLPALGGQGQGGPYACIRARILYVTVYARIHTYTCAPIIYVTVYALMRARTLYVTDIRAYARV